ncbi:ribonuclease inhibitor-like [Styela clava]
MDEEAFDVLGDLLSNYEVDQLIAKNCQLTKAKLDALGSHSGLKLSKFDISENPMNEKGFNALGSLLTANNEVIDLVIQNCQLTKEKLDALGSHSGLKICTLDIRSITGMPFDLFLAISKFATESEVEELLMDPWKKFKATKDQIMELSKWKVCGKLDELNVSDNKDLGTSGFSEVGLVVTKYQVKALMARNCNLTAERMKAFKENTRNAKLEILDIGWNNKLGTSGFGEVGSVVSKCQVKELDASHCNLTAEGIRSFKENTSNAKLDILDISENDNLDTAGWGEVGLVVSKCQVKELKAVSCNLTAEGMKAFKEHTSNAKIDILHLSRNYVSKLRDEGLSTISEIVHQCQVKKLYMWFCEFNDDQLERFKALIADTRVEFVGF